MEKTMDKIIALAKARGFVYPGSEIYGGLANTWDYGNLGVELKNNVKRAWWQKLKGSGRTYGNIHLKNQVLDPCKEYFFAYGGHAGAAGMTIPEKNLMLFRNKVRKLDIPVLYREKRILYDLEVTKEEIPELYEKMEFFAPFGEGNPEPVFFIRNLELSPVRGKFYEQNGSDGKSIKLFTMPYPSSGYQMAAEYLLMDAPKKIDMTFEVYTIYSHGKEHRRLRMLDFCASKNAETETSFKKELSAMLNFM